MREAGRLVDDGARPPRARLPIVGGGATTRLPRRVASVVAPFASVLTLQATQLVAVAAAFATNLAASASLVPSGRGALALWVQIGYFATTAAVLGVERPFVSMRQGATRQPLRELAWLTRPGVVVAALPMIGGGVAACLGHRELVVVGVVTSVFVAGNLLARLVRTAFITGARARAYWAATLVSQVGLVTCALAFVLVGVDSPVVWLGSYALSTAPFVVVVCHAVRSSRRAEGDAGRLDVGPLAEVRRSGLALLPASFGNTALLRADRLLLPVLAGTAALGAYVTIASVVEAASWPVQNWVDSRLGVWRRQVEVTGRVARGPVVALAAVAAVLSVSAGGVGVLVVVTLLSEAYRSSLALVPALTVASFAYSLSRIWQGVLVAHGRHAGVSVIETVGAVVTVVLCVVLIPGSGAQGAAWASAVGYGVCLVLCGLVPVVTDRWAGRA
ncbi:hypothetical protein ABID81_002649 [Frigoribacterium sp. PvP054]